MGCLSNLCNPRWEICLTGPYPSNGAVRRREAGRVPRGGSNAQCSQRMEGVTVALGEQDVNYRRRYYLLSTHG